jgi:hypothetical protein
MKVTEVEKKVLSAHSLLLTDKSHKSSDEVVKGLTYGDLLLILKQAGDFIDHELFLQGK